MDALGFFGFILAVFSGMYLIEKIFGIGKPRTKSQDYVTTENNSRRTPQRRQPGAARSMRDSAGSRDIKGFSSGDDDDLATFTISFGQTESTSTNKAPGRWIVPGQPVNVASHHIVGGNFYFGGKLKAIDRFGEESSLIDDSLAVQDAPMEYSDSTLGYWPKYLAISPKCRGAYLKWMASGRDNPNTPLGYVFLYFYGIERRVVYESTRKGLVSDTEFQELAWEVRRLLSVYGKNPTFSSYAFRLLEWMKLLRPALVQISSEEIYDHNLRQLFSIMAGKIVRAREPIPASMAYIWLGFTNFVPKTPARRCPDEFKRLFCKLYEGKYGQGMVVKPNKTFVKPYYQPASSSLSNIILKATELPDPTVLGSVSGKLTLLANTATQKLDAYSRYLGKEGNTAKDAEALMLLPDELSGADHAETLFPEFVHWANEIVENHAGLASLQDLWSHLSDEPLDKINKKEMTLIQGVTERTGFGFAPDPRFHHVKPTPDGNIVLFKGGHGDMVSPSNTFNEIGMAIRLGAMVANIDGHVHDAEVRVLQDMIDRNVNLAGPAKASLHAYLTWRLHAPQNMASLKKQLEHLDDKAKEGVSRILVSVALADGKISPDEIKQMEKLYTSLGLDKSMVTSDIHGLTTTRVPPSSEGHTPKSEQPESGFRLDDSVLARHESETEDVQGMLGAIFAEDDPDEAVEDVDAEDTPDDDEDGLDPAHRKLVDQLITRETWPREEFEALCDGLGLMADGALETINDWSFDLVDDPLLEDDDDIFVMLDVAEQIANQ